METTEPITAVYLCTACDLAIIERLPAGLKGEFYHAHCWRDLQGDAILDADTIE